MIFIEISEQLVHIQARMKQLQAYMLLGKINHPFVLRTLCNNASTLFTYSSSLETCHNTRKQKI